MSRFGAALFANLQDAHFYLQMHAAAVDLLPAGARLKWLDVGCGPGLLARLAVARGHDVRAIDADRDMIAQANEIAARTDCSVKFAVARLEDVFAGERNAFDIVSASSVLAVLPDPHQALRQLVSMAKPRGAVLIIEAAVAMSRRRALALAFSGRLGRGASLLPLWAMARAGRAVPESVFDQLGLRARRHPLLAGLANAWIVERAA